MDDQQKQETWRDKVIDLLMSNRLCTDPITASKLLKKIKINWLYKPKEIDRCLKRGIPKNVWVQLGQNTVKRAIWKG